MAATAFGIYGGRSLDDDCGFSGYFGFIHCILGVYCTSAFITF